jgi:hypothetical protein
VVELNLGENNSARSGFGRSKLSASIMCYLNVCLLHNKGKWRSSISFCLEIYYDAGMSVKYVEHFGVKWTYLCWCLFYNLYVGVCNSFVYITCTLFMQLFLHLFIIASCMMTFLAFQVCSLPHLHP